MSPDTLDLSVLALREGYLAGTLTPGAVIDTVLARCEACDDPAIWISRLDRAALQPYLDRLREADPENLPLYGVPFAIKDNIDLAGIPTTAACPGFAHVPGRSAFVVARLIAAGAIPIGKTNLDQFATGLVGTRSPYGVPRNAFSAEHIPGGSSSGSAVAVARGLVSFALGTDTAGSGRVPAAFNNLVGIKPSRGLLSTTGVLPACRTLDCVSLFALDMADADAVLAVAAHFDPDDPYARPAAPGPAPREAFRFGVPGAGQLEFLGDADYQRLFGEAVATLERLGGQAVTIDFEPFAEAARLLYEGPWVAERYAALRGFIESDPEALHPVTRAIIAPARELGAVAAFEAQYRLAALRRRVEPVLADLDFVLTPTAATCWRLDQVAAEPVLRNSQLGLYTNFMNLLDLAAVALPAGFRGDGLPFGITLFAGAFSDAALAHYAGRLQGALSLPRGAHGLAPRADTGATAGEGAEAGAMLRLVVCGAHMEGLALNHQLTERGGRLLRRTHTAPRYRLYALAGGPPRRPGLIRDDSGGAPIEVEVWELPIETIGSFLRGIPAPLGLGTLELADGSWEKGFICEGHAASAAGAEEITALGGFRAWLAHGA